MGPDRCRRFWANCLPCEVMADCSARQELEDAWNAAVGEPYCRQTRLGEVRRGVLNVTVAHSTLLEELAAFRKPALLAALRSGAPATTIHDIRFRVGRVALEVEPEQRDGFALGRGAEEPAFPAPAGHGDAGQGTGANQAGAPALTRLSHDRRRHGPAGRRAVASGLGEPTSTKPRQLLSRARSVRCEPALWRSSVATTVFRLPDGIPPEIRHETS